MKKSNTRNRIGNSILFIVFQCNYTCVLCVCIEVGIFRFTIKITLKCFTFLKKKRSFFLWKLRKEVTQIVDTAPPCLIIPHCLRLNTHSMPTQSTECSQKTCPTHAHNLNRKLHQKCDVETSQ